MGSFFIDLLSFDHEVAVFERDAQRMRFTYNCQRFTTPHKKSRREQVNDKEKDIHNAIYLR